MGFSENRMSYHVGTKFGTTCDQRRPIRDKVPLTHPLPQTSKWRNSRGSVTFSLDYTNLIKRMLRERPDYEWELRCRTISPRSQLVATPLKEVGRDLVQTSSKGWIMCATVSTWMQTTVLFFFCFFTHPARVCAERNRKKTAPHPTAESDMKFFCFKILVFELSNIQNSNTSFYAPCWYKTAPSLLLCLYVKQFQSCQSFEIRKSDAENRNGHDL